MLGRHIPRSSFINLLTVYTFGLIRLAIVLVTVNAIYIYIMVFWVYCTFAEISTAEGEVDDSTCQLFYFGCIKTLVGTR